MQVFGNMFFSACVTRLNLTKNQKHP